MRMRLSILLLHIFSYVFYIHIICNMILSYIICTHNAYRLYTPDKNTICNERLREIKVNDNDM